MPSASDTAVRELARAILARREYARAGDAVAEPPFAEWIRRFLEWMNQLDALHRSSPALYWAIVLLVVSILIALVTHTAWMLHAALHASDSEPEPPLRPARLDLAQAANELASEGRYLEAAHSLMIASFRALAERTVIDLRPDHSNRWIRDAVQRSALASDLVAEIDTLITRTENRWFGTRGNDPELYGEWRILYQRLLAAAI